MIRINAIPNSAAAKKYYSSADYYLEGHEAQALWHGNGAELLGLSGAVNQDDFERLCDNLHPKTGTQLTAKTLDNRRVGYDFTFSVPKSVSIAYSLGQDERLPDAFRAAVADTMAEMERKMATRVRRKGADHDRTTGNMLWCDFLHHTSRPIDGSPDPQLHVHAVVFNATFDPEEGQWKAGQFGELKKNAPYYQAAFRARLATRLQHLGYEIRKTKDDFELLVPDRTVKEFSRRTDLIEKVASKLGIKRPETKAKLGATTRSAKLRDGQTWASLLTHWEKRLKPGELEQINRIVADAMQGPLATEDKSRESVDWALAHLLERRSAVPELQVVTTALQHGLGSVTPEDVWKQTQRPDLLRKEIKGQVYVSTKGVLQEEQRIVRFAQKGRGRYRPLSLGDYAPATVLQNTATTAPDAQAKKEGGSWRPQKINPNVSVRADTATVPHRGQVASAPDTNVGHKLSPSQQAAVRHVLTSPDRLILIRGAAGTGKTTLTKTALEAVNVPWQILAPSSEASRGVLRRDGFESADTLARFLIDEEMQESVRNGLIWLDEASLASSPDIAKLVDTAEQLNARIVLSGDRRQHKSVARGDVLALLEDKAGLPVATVSEIKRQAGQYKDAIEALAKGDIATGFAKLDALGWIKEGNAAQNDPNMTMSDPTCTRSDDFVPMHELIAADYIAALRDGKSVLVVSPTHQEGEAVTAAIRAELRTKGCFVRKDGTVREEGVLQGEEKTFERLEPLRWTEAEKARPESYQDGLVVQFHRNSGAFRSGEREHVTAENAEALADQAGRHQVYRAGSIRLAAGDLLRLTANGKDITGSHRLNNGAQYTVAGFTDAGNIRLNNGWVLSKDFGHFTHGYVVTSHAAQGRTVDRVLIAQGLQSLPASNAAQFYVSVSRGRQQATIYTDNKAELLEAVQREDHRLLATDLVTRPRRLRDRLKRHVALLREIGHIVRGTERSIEREVRTHER